VCDTQRKWARSTASIGRDAACLEQWQPIAVQFMQSAGGSGAALVPKVRPESADI
jgi:hypothetical protein